MNFEMLDKYLLSCKKNENKTNEWTDKQENYYVDKNWFCMQLIQTPNNAENSPKDISESPSVLNILKITCVSSGRIFLSIIRTSFVNSSKLRLPSLLLSKFVKICLRFKLWFFIIRLSSFTSFLAFSLSGLKF